MSQIGEAIGWEEFNSEIDSHNSFICFKMGWHHQLFKALFYKVKIFLEQVVHWKECEGMGAVVTSQPHLKLKGDF